VEKRGFRCRTVLKSVLTPDVFWYPSDEPI
jgi:hypothetical protein